MPPVTLVGISGLATKLKPETGSTMSGDAAPPGVALGLRNGPICVVVAGKRVLKIRGAGAMSSWTLKACPAVPLSVLPAASVEMENDQYGWVTVKVELAGRPLIFCRLTIRKVICWPGIGTPVTKVPSNSSRKAAMAPATPGTVLNLLSATQ